MIPLPSRRRRAFAGAMALLGGALPLSAASPKAATDLTVLATIGKQHITQAEVLAQDPTAFERETSEYQRQLRLLEEHHAQARHALLQQQLGKLLDQTALQREAAKRGVAADTALAEIKVSARQRRGGAGLLRRQQGSHQPDVRAAGAPDQAVPGSTAQRAGHPGLL